MNASCLLLEAPSPLPSSESERLSGGEVQPLRAIVTLVDIAEAETAIEALQAWLAPHLGSVELSWLLSVESPPRLENSVEQSHVVVLRRPSRALGGAICEMLAGVAVRPELILIDAPHPVPEELRERGIPVAFHLRGESSTERLGQAILDTFRIQIPLRESCQRALGKLSLHDTLALVRMYMLHEAFTRTCSKRGAARELGVTRPAVQQMLRTQTAKAARR